jgi:hypothetical protein
MLVLGLTVAGLRVHLRPPDHLNCQVVRAKHLEAERGLTFVGWTNPSHEGQASVCCCDEILIRQRRREVQNLRQRGAGGLLR